MSRTSSRPFTLCGRIVILVSGFWFADRFVRESKTGFHALRESRSSRLSKDGRFYNVSARADNRVAIMKDEETTALSVSRCDFANLRSNFVFCFLNCVFNNFFTIRNFSTFYSGGGKVKLPFFRTFGSNVTCVVGVVERFQGGGRIATSHRSKVGYGPTDFVSRRFGGRSALI